MIPLGVTPIFSSPADYARAVNLVMAAGVIVYAIIDWRYFARADRGRLLGRLALLAFTVASAMASWETLVDDSPAPGIRSYFFTLALGWAIASIVVDRRDRRP